jgi:hypothetical protein
MPGKVEVVGKPLGQQMLNELDGEVFAYDRALA